jgi:23S rRNA (guanosine2251-2'-O)-methyltransferase
MQMKLNFFRSCAFLSCLLSVMSRKRLLQRTITTSRFVLNSNSVSGLVNHRFWTRYYKLPERNSTLSEVNHISDQLRDASQGDNAIDISRVEMGILFSTQTNVVVPIHEGKLQEQHTTMLPDSLRSSNSNNTFNEDMLFLCAFSPRAGQVTVAPIEEERILNVERRDAINLALEELSINWEDLLTAKFAGTPPGRIYRSFCSPKAKAIHILEPVERAATRAAAQLQLALRQLRADEASYLRNTDKAPLNVLSPNAPQEERKSNPVVLVLDNIRSAFNVGSMFRTGETAGVSEIITCGITAHPPHPKLRKTALSATDSVPFRHFEDIMVAIATLKEEGHTIVAMETTSRSQVYTDVDYPLKVALVVGNEVTGVDTRVMESADIIAEIPTYGVKNSLNVASAAPIVVFEVLRQWSKKKLI